MNNLVGTQINTKQKSLCVRWIFEHDDDRFSISQLLSCFSSICLGDLGLWAGIRLMTGPIWFDKLMNYCVWNNSLVRAQDKSDYNGMAITPCPLLDWQTERPTHTHTNINTSVLFYQNIRPYKNLILKQCCHMMLLLKTLKRHNASFSY